jgi:hypothetical protein
MRYGEVRPGKSVVKVTDWGARVTTVTSAGAPAGAPLSVGAFPQPPNRNTKATPKYHLILARRKNPHPRRGIFAANMGLVGATTDLAGRLSAVYVPRFPIVSLE